MNITAKKYLSGIVKNVERDSQILALFLFGSAARGDNYKQSDVDICLVLMPGSYVSKELSQKKLEYLKLFNLDIQVFQQLPVYIKKRVISEAKVLFCRDEDKLYEIAFSVMREFADFEHIYRDYLKEMSYVG